MVLARALAPALVPNWSQDCGIARRCKLFVGTEFERGAIVQENLLFVPAVERASITECFTRSNFFYNPESFPTALRIVGYAGFYAPRDKNVLVPRFFLTFFISRHVFLRCLTKISYKRLALLLGQQDSAPALAFRLAARANPASTAPHLSPYLVPALQSRCQKSRHDPATSSLGVGQKESLSQLLASPLGGRVSPVLDLEGTPWPTRTTGYFERGSRTDPQGMKERNGKPSDYLFPSQWNPEKPLSGGYFHKCFAATTQAADLDIAKQHPHAMRQGLGFTMSAAGFNPQTIAQALGHQTARMALQFHGSVTDEVADGARKETFAKYSWL